MYLSEPAGSRTQPSAPTILLPENVHVGNKSITLTCDYDLHGERLYSVKWYKSNSEFYRFGPVYDPQKQVFPLPGINVNVSEATIL